ncbi:hypothetical protein PI125_g2228 [Phytophthora idaei]|nr:hypothetical protein PI125_g2228 [Phytophthora idaei]
MQKADWQCPHVHERRSHNLGLVMQRWAIQQSQRAAAASAGIKSRGNAASTAFDPAREPAAAL